MYIFFLMPLKSLMISLSPVLITRQTRIFIVTFLYPLLFAIVSFFLLIYLHTVIPLLLELDSLCDLPHLYVFVQNILAVASVLGPFQTTHGAYAPHLEIAAFCLCL